MWYENWQHKHSSFKSKVKNNFKFVLGFFIFIILFFVLILVFILFSLHASLNSHYGEALELQEKEVQPD